MAIKKPVTTKSTLLKKRPREVEEEEEEVVEEEEEEAPKKKLKKAAPVEEEEEPEEEEEVEPVKKKLKKKAPQVEEEEEPEEEEEEAPRRKGSLKKKKKGARKSFASVFDSTKPGRGLLPVGDYRAYVAGYELEGDIAEEGEDQGELKAKVIYEIHEDEDEGIAGKSISQYYQLCDEDGNAGPGIPYLKGDLDILGYEEVLLEDLEEIFRDVEAERPEVLIKVKQNGQYTNAYLQGLADGE